MKGRWERAGLLLRLLVGIALATSVGALFTDDSGAIEAVLVGLNLLHVSTLWFQAEAADREGLKWIKDRLPGVGEALVVHWHNESTIETLRIPQASVTRGDRVVTVEMGTAIDRSKAR